MRAVSGSSFASFQRAAVFTAAAVYPSSSSFAAAATRSVSSVMYVFLIQSAVFDFVDRRRRSSLVLATNSLAEPSSAEPPPAATGEVAGGLEAEAQDSSRPAREAMTRMAAQTTRARRSPHEADAWLQVFGTTGPVSRICVSSSPARSAYSVRRREARRSLRHSSRLMFCTTSTYACTSVWYRR